MGALDQEIQNVQNPALGAMLLWRFAIGYSDGSKVSEPTPMPLLFLVLPMLYHEDTASFVTSTQQRTGLRAFAGKFSDSRIAKTDLLFAIQNRSLNMRNLTLESMGLALASRLISIDYDNGAIIGLSSTPPQVGVPQSVRSLMRASEKLGYWCSEVSLFELSTILKVGF